MAKFQKIRSREEPKQRVRLGQVARGWTSFCVMASRGKRERLLGTPGHAMSRQWRRTSFDWSSALPQSSSLREPLLDNRDHCRDVGYYIAMRGCDKSRLVALN